MTVKFVSPFQRSLTEEILKILQFKQLSYELLELKSEEFEVPEYILLKLYDGAVVVYIYDDEAQAHDYRDKSRESFVFENYDGNQAERIKSDMLQTIRHLASGSDLQSQRNNDENHVPTRTVNLFDITETNEKNEDELDKNRDEETFASLIKKLTYIVLFVVAYYLFLLVSSK